VERKGTFCAPSQSSELFYARSDAFFYVFRLRSRRAFSSMIIFKHTHTSPRAKWESQPQEEEERGTFCSLLLENCATKEAAAKEERERNLFLLQPVKNESTKQQPTSLPELHLTSLSRAPRSPRLLQLRSENVSGEDNFGAARGLLYITIVVNDALGLVLGAKRAERCNLSLGDVNWRAVNDPLNGSEVRRRC
jgi:hypothetical protein